LTFRRGHPP